MSTRRRQPIERLDSAGIERRVDELVKRLGARSRADAFKRLDKGQYGAKPEALTLRALRPLVA